MMTTLQQRRMERAEHKARVKAAYKFVNYYGPIIARGAHVPGWDAMDWRDAIESANAVTCCTCSAPPVDLDSELPSTDDEDQPEEVASRSHRSRAPPPRQRNAAPSAEGRGNSSRWNSAATKDQPGASTKPARKNQIPKVTVTLGRSTVGFISTAKPFAAFDINGKAITGLFPTRCAAISAIIDASRDDGRVA